MGSVLHDKGAGAEMRELNTEAGDTLVITLGENMAHYEVDEIMGSFKKMFKDQQLNIVIVPGGVKLDLIKSSNLEDNYDSGIREDNPALQAAWEQYQTIKGLTVKDDK